MRLLKMPDEEIVKLAKPILLDTIVGANNSDWALFSKHMPFEDSSNAEIQADVERQWQEDPYLTAFRETPEFLGVIRKSEGVAVLWKLTCTVNDDEYLEKLYLEERDGVILQTGIWTE